MSHFTVAVICNKKSNLKNILEPFNEQTKDKSLLTFCNKEDELRNEYENKGSKEWYADINHNIKDLSIIEETEKTGKIIFIEKDPFDINKIIIGNKVCLYNNDNPEDIKQIYVVIDNYRLLSFEEVKKHLGLKGLISLRRILLRLNFESFKQQVERIKLYEIKASLIDEPKIIPYKETYKTFDDFAIKYHGYEKDKETNQYGYWENKNAKWDWWVLGGRWKGSLLVKENKESKLGESGAFNNEVDIAPEGYKWVDFCKISDICWSKMQQISEFNLLKNEREDGDLWDILTEKINIGRKRMDYAWEGGQYFIEKYKTKENYIKSITNFSTYAVITPDRVWHSPGDMGWFGFSSESNEEKLNFENSYFEKFIKPYKHKYIAIIDCHI